ncbi:MAG: P-loop ATPase, Sll1717 family [Flammeovirgaceae bacterium]
MNKLELIQKVTFGESIAELEAQKLKDYFLKTEFWKLIRNGTNDIVYGGKGAGKSAIYTSITNDIDTLFDEGILVSIAENPTGNTAFSNLKNDPPTTETEFVRLWKLYFLVITAQVFDEYGINDKHAKKVREILTDCNLIPAQNKLASFLKVCFDFMRSFKNGKEVSTTAEFDLNTGMYSGQKFSLSFGEPTKHDFEKGLIPIEYAYDLLQKSLLENKIKLWIIIDRLDVAFLESEDLETNALRALFKAYLDLAQFNEIKIKVFLRDDIWQRITSEGFREASHITKFQNLQWSKESLLNLIIRRILDNSELVSAFSLNKTDILSDIAKQEQLFYRLFPAQIDLGSRKSATLDWILSRTMDGKGTNSPRELIQLFTHARTIESKRQENGINELENDQLISRQAFKEAVYEVSKQRLEQTIYAEFPALKQYIELLRGDKAEQNVETLMNKWSLDKRETTDISKKLVSIGFFEQRGEILNPKYKIPFMYRPYLDITQGSATTDSEE